MHATSARHVLGEVSTGPAVESAGRPPVASRQEGSLMDSGTGAGRVPGELVVRWELAYGQYVTEDRAPVTRHRELARLSASVAEAWRAIAATRGLDWWLVAALMTAAEAFERQSQWLPKPRPVADGRWFGSSDDEGPGGGGE